MVSAAQPFPPAPPPQLLESQKGCGLPPAGQHCCSPSRTRRPHSPLPLPHNPSLRAGGRLQRAGGKALPYGARGPGDCRSLGLGPVAMGAAPRILHSRHSLGSGVESHWPGLCSLHVTGRATVSWSVPPAWHHVLSHPAPSVPDSLVTEDRAAPPSIHDCAAPGQVSGTGSQEQGE